VTPIQSLEEQATDFARRGDFGVAARQVNEELTKAAPANAGAWTRLGRCCLELGQLDEATAALETALQLNAQNTIASSLQQEVGRRRAKLSAAIPPVKKPRPSATKGRGKAAAPIVGGFGRPEFATLAQLPAAAAVEALGPRIEAILMALNDRPFGDKIVEARNRAGHAGGKLFRRNSFYPGGAGHIYAFQHGGRWEPQLNRGFFAESRFGRSGIRAGIGFNLKQGEVDREGDAGLERLLANFEAVSAAPLLRVASAADGLDGRERRVHSTRRSGALAGSAAEGCGELARDDDRWARARMDFLRPLALRRSAGRCGGHGERDQADQDDRADVHRPAAALDERVPGV
jgi:tetratricopeptide (TPR) repeat protein